MLKILSQVDSRQEYKQITTKFYSDESGSFSRQLKNYGPIIVAAVLVLIIFIVAVALWRRGRLQKMSLNQMKKEQLEIKRRESQIRLRQSTVRVKSIMDQRGVSMSPNH